MYYTGPLKPGNRYHHYGNGEQLISDSTVDNILTTSRCIIRFVCICLFMIIFMLPLGCNETPKTVIKPRADFLRDCGQLYTDPNT